MAYRGRRGGRSAGAAGAAALRLAAAVGAAILATGCATSTVPWGSTATFAPGWQRVGEAARAAATDPAVWAPVAGAALVQVDDADHRISRWARREAPLFGSRDNAEDWSDYLRDGSRVVHYATILAAPSGDRPGAWLANKLRGGVVHAAAAGGTATTMGRIKRAFPRQRPDRLSDDSFASGHASSAAVHATLASRTLEYLPADAARPFLDAGLAAIAVGTAWARVEGGRHYPSDVLFGLGFGRFVGAFVNDAFLGRAPVVVAPTVDGLAVLWRFGGA